ncbi:MAG: hypothetical protein U0172_05795 [Nitrospiraceae bacterium]
MAKAHTTPEQDEARLQKKVQSSLKDQDKAKGNPAVRSLRKRLKRTQRKRRALAARNLRAKGNTGEKKS